MNPTSEDLRQLERAMFRAWPSFETIEYDGWILRFADGYTKRANSANPHFGSEIPPMTKLAHCEALYEERELPMIFRLTPFSQPAELDSMLEKAGYGLVDPSLVVTSTLDRAPDLTTGSALHVSGDEWFAAFDSLRGLAVSERAAHRRIIDSSEGERCFVTVTKGRETIACGLGIHLDDAVGLFDLYTAEPHRNCGLGAAVVNSILHWAYQRAARSSFLQVHSRNVLARRFYEKLGFAEAYPYWYRVKS